jgi:hypothetical protein
MTIPELQESQRRMHTSTNRDNPIIEGLVKGGLQNAPMNLQTSSPITVPVPVGPQVPMGGPLQDARGMPPGAMGGQDHMPPFVPDVKQNLNEVLTATLKDGDSIATKTLEGLIQRAGVMIQGMVEMTQQPPEQIREDAGGGLMQLAAEGEFQGRVPGDGHGMEDNVYMPIRERNEDVGTLAVSPSEYVVDSYTMAALGNGNADEGADVMDEVVEQVRERAYGNREQPNEINGLDALRPMLERV